MAVPGSTLVVTAETGVLLASGGQGRGAADHGAQDSPPQPRVTRPKCQEHQVGDTLVRLVQEFTVLPDLAQQTARGQPG